jgi:hypothetical protein
MSEVLEMPPEPISAPVDRSLMKSAEALWDGFSNRRLAKVGGTFRGGLEGGIEWNAQRDIDDPNDEAGEGVAGVADHFGVGNFYRMLASDQEHDADGKNLHKVGTHLLAAKLSHVADDHDSCHYHLGKAMEHFAAFHKALKAATKD